LRVRVDREIRRGIVANITLTALVKPVPVIVMTAPPAVVPELADSAVTVGVATEL